MDKMGKVDLTHFRSTQSYIQFVQIAKWLGPFFFQNFLSDQERAPNISSQLTFACLKSAVETLEKGVKYVLS